MKKILAIFFCFALICTFYVRWSQSQSQEKQYLKKETYIKHLKKELFLAKLANPLPAWMKDQIDEDFREVEKITKAQMDTTFAQIQKTYPTPFIVRYRILENELYRYFRSEERISLEDTSTELAIKTLMQCVSLPDLDFIISFFDGVRPSHTFFHTSSADLQAPLLISAKIKNTPYAVLVPDFRSIGHWWISDIKHIKSRMDQFPWERKKEFAIWRGANSRKERIKLCQISLLHPQQLDAKFTRPIDDIELEKEGLVGERISWEEFLECKYLPYVDGFMTAAPALQWRLLSNSVTFKPETNEIQWFYRALEPYVHYIPVKTDLTDLIEKFDWAKSHDSQCKQIAHESTQFALNHLMYEDVLLYFNAVLNRYASLQEMDLREMKKEIETDPRWVKIQYRSALRKKAERNQMSGYYEGSSPGTAIVSASETSSTP